MRKKLNCEHLLNTSDGFRGLQDNGSLKVLEDLISILPYVLQGGDFQYLWQRDQWSVEKTTELVGHGQIQGHLSGKYTNQILTFPTVLYK